jgi:hypothetical protein
VDIVSPEVGQAQAVAALGRCRVAAAGGWDDVELVLLRDGRFAIVRDYGFRQPPSSRRQVSVYESLDSALQAVPALHRRAVGARVTHHLESLNG